MQNITGVHMIKPYLKHILVLSVLAVSFSAHAINLNKELLAKECRDLAENISSLVSSQGRQSCVEKLGMASIQIETAGDLILEDNYATAKQELENAVYSLQYAELNTCNRYIQIAHSKLEAQRIKNSL